MSNSFISGIKVKKKIRENYENFSFPTISFCHLKCLK